MKKIAIIENGWAKFINYAWTLGIKQYVDERGIDADIYIFNSFGDVGMDEKFNHGEYNITKLSDLTMFDGIFLELTNIGDEKEKAEIIERVKASKVPAISLVEKIPGLYYAGIDNYNSMAKMVEHLITVHHCQKINFVGGPPANQENIVRLAAYRDVLAKHGIAVEEERIFQCNYEIITGEIGFTHFHENGLLPDAFVCANDNIAVGICHESEKYGYRVPEDFLVTGFDDFDKASYYSPRISTIGFRRESISYAAMGMMCRIWDGTQEDDAVYIEAEATFQDSCGCVPEHTKDRGQYANERIIAEDIQSRLQTKLYELKREMINCNSYVEIAACLPKSLSMLGYDEMYILLNKDLDEMLEHEEEPEYRTDGYPDNMNVLFAARKDQILSGLKRLPGQLIPGDGEQYEEAGSTYLFSPLHIRDREIGYTILKNCDHLMDSQMLYEVLNAFLETTQNMYHRMTLARMNDKLSNLYIRDSLTGLYNRMAYNKLAIPEYERCMQNDESLLIMFWDLDCLKYINDNFGHDMGNEAIRVVTDAIRECCPKEAIAMRYGGDEFVVLVPEYAEDRAKHLVTNIEHRILEKGMKMNVPFEIQASVGYVIADNPSKSLNDYINIADDAMYRNKKARKATN